MKRDVRLNIILVEAVAIIIVALLLLRSRSKQDTTAPEITFPQEAVTYTQGTDAEMLLRGVTAQDDRDGDVTSSLTVVSVSDMGDGRAIAVYNAKDSGNNVAMTTRTVYFTADESARFRGVPVNTLLSDVQVIEDDETESQAGAESARDTQPDIESAAPAGDESSVAVESAPSQSSSSDQDTVYAADDVLASYEGMSPYEFTSEDLETIGKALRSETETAAGSLPEGSPVIGLQVHAIQQDIGTSLNPLDLIGSIDDAEDPVDYIFSQIHVEGNAGFKTDEAGTYIFRYYVIDSDGHTSNVARLFVVVR